MFVMVKNQNQKYVYFALYIYIAYNKYIGSRMTGIKTGVAVIPATLKKRR